MKFIAILTAITGWATAGFLAVTTIVAEPEVRTVTKTVKVLEALPFKPTGDQVAKVLRKVRVHSSGLQPMRQGLAVCNVHAADAPKKALWYVVFCNVEEPKPKKHAQGVPATPTS